MKRLISTNSSFVTALLFATALAGQPAFAGDECGAEGGAEGDLYVADSGAQNRVLQYDGITGDFVCEFVHDGSGGLTNPNGVTFGPNGNLFVASSEIGNHAVLEYDGANGDFIRKFASDCELDNPVGLAFGPNGNLFVACQCSSSVIEYDGMTGACVNTHCDGLPVATGLAFDSAGDLFVASQGGEMWKLDLDLMSCEKSFDLLGNPHGVLVRDNGNLLVANRGGDRIDQYDADNGTYLGIFADRCGLDEPYGMTFGPNGNLFVASLMSGEVIEYDGDGNCVDPFASVSGAPTFLEFKSTQPPECQTDSDCDDGEFCNGPETCEDGTCTGDTPLDCDDGEACTDDSCDPEAGCVNTPDDTNSCDDGNACTTNDFCDAGSCTGDTPLDCDDDIACTFDFCSGVTGLCENSPLDGLCNDGNPCTDNNCDPQSGCVSTPNTESCDDGNACTENDFCAGGACSGSSIDCDDGNPCTDDDCDPLIGCVFTPNCEPCDDSDVCTIGDTCSDGFCSGTSVDCSGAGEICHAASCNPDGPAGNCGILTQASDGTPCDTGNPCTSDDSGLCADGECVEDAVDCDDGKPCTIDSCDPATGCCVNTFECPADLNCDGEVGPADLAMLLASWGPCVE